MAKKYDTWPVDEVLARYMNPVQAQTLRRFAEEEGLDEDTVKWMAQISGRGYRHPHTVEGWRERWQFLQRILADIGEGDDA